MARTVGDVITRARAAIGDAAGVRADTPTCEGYVVDALNMIKTIRPDLFIGQFKTVLESLTSTDPIPIDAQFFMPLAMYVGAMIESQDDESADRARGQLLGTIASGVFK
jgi:hypothetical protein